jgi:hypothetical protein
MSNDKIPSTGDVYKIQNNRLCVVASSVTLDSLTLYSVLPVSSAIYMASEKDFIVVEEPVFKKDTIMLEAWNSMAVPIEFFDSTKLKGRLSDKYIRYLSSYIYFSLQNRKNENLTILTGPPLNSSSDIRWLFRQMEIKEFHNLRKTLVSVSE